MITNEGFTGFVWRTFLPGTSVVVGEGPLQGLRGTVIGIDCDDHLIVVLTYVSRSIQVELDPTTVYLDHAVSAQEFVEH